MRKALISLIVLSTALTLSAQTGAAVPKKSTAPTKSAAKKPAAPAAKPAATAAEPTAILHTTAGDLTCTLFPKQAPKTVENFIGLANGTKQWTDPKKGVIVKGKPLYDGVIFHRVIPNFMVQTGDPIGNGTGGPGYKFEDEFVPELRFDQPGRLAMANSGPATNGSQFFITEVPTPWLNDRHTIFGQCDAPSIDLVRQIARVATDPRNNRPDQDIKITHIEIVGAGKPAATAKPGAKKPATATKAPAKASPTKK